MVLALITLLTALGISAVAAFYSIVGLMAIFSASAWSIAVMGVVLEVGKLITASWLYQNWKKVPFLLKTYLTIAVVILMFITSMGLSIPILVGSEGRSKDPTCSSASRSNDL